jgi:nucleoside 2-deoxyribosyltransferase
MGFCISDFTEQKDGVYFEAGYALGRGLKVIYTCEEGDFKNSHFDTNHFPHIIYKNEVELEEKLINKIEAWIKD